MEGEDEGGGLTYLRPPPTFTCPSESHSRASVQTPSNSERHWHGDGFSLWALAAGKSPSAELGLLELTYQSLRLMDGRDRQGGCWGRPACLHVGSIPAHANCLMDCLA
ncbi:unnamed protein product [Pleuronectes platessa]|uniref:Uncharacterized protein n=1 Tax=Pleuronectes platessa TaxID=8262 RepID=A0A9N7VMW6_PLEPL|nr:unnamed protein product [Pleuronectes platessa]